MSRPDGFNRDFEPGVGSDLTGSRLPQRSRLGIIPETSPAENCASVIFRLVPLPFKQILFPQSFFNIGL